MSNNGRVVLEVGRVYTEEGLAHAQVRRGRKLGGNRIQGDIFVHVFEDDIYLINESGGEFKVVEHYDSRSGELHKLMEDVK